MVDQRLVTYIRNELQKGYSKDTIRGTLIKYGYPQDQIVEGFRQARPSRVKLFTFVILIAFTLGSTAVYFLYFNTQTTLQQASVRSMPVRATLTPHFQPEVAINESGQVEPSIAEEEKQETDPGEEQAIKDIVFLAAEEPTKARDLCIELMLRDQCLLDAGVTVHDQLFCGPIRNDDKRDTCYFNLALVAQSNLLCQDITDQHLKSTCAQI